MKGTYIEMKEEIAIVTGSNRGIGFACVSHNQNELFRENSKSLQTLHI